MTPALDSALERIHGTLVHDRRTTILARRIADLLPPAASVLDVGAGDGLLAARLCTLRPDLRLRGADVLVRLHTHIPVDRFDGESLPYEDASWDAVTLVDVVHHARSPERLLRECARVARQCVVVKDHLRQGFAAGATLRLMDWVGNARHGVNLPYHYLSITEWQRALRDARLDVEQWDERLALYPVPLRQLFDRRLHFLARLRPTDR